MARLAPRRLCGLDELSFVPRGEAGRFIAGHNIASRPQAAATDGGGLSYMH